MPVRSFRGFTLIELLVALLIMSLLAAAGYRGLTAVLQAREAVSGETRKWQQLSLFFSRMELDFSQALHRPVRDQNGIAQPELTGLGTVTGDDDAQLTFTRGGVEDEGDAQRTPQRIGYRLSRDTIELLRWPALDLPPNAKPRHYPLLSGVQEFKLRYMASAGVWSEQWPPPGQQQITGLPSALEVSVTLASGEKIVRDFALLQ